MKCVRDLSTKEPRQVKLIIFPSFTVEASSLEFFESELKIFTSSNRCFRFIVAVLGKLHLACVVQEVS